LEKHLNQSGSGAFVTQTKNRLKENIVSTHTSKTKITTAKIKSMKGKGRIVSLTAHTKTITQLMDPYVDLIVVGDSLGMVAYGFDSTLPVTIEMMISHGSAVVRGAETSCVIVDMPFGSYQESKQLAYKNAAEVMAQTGAQGIKIEGGSEMLETVEFLIKRGIPVMPHIGLCPQYANVLGGFKVQGKHNIKGTTSPKQHENSKKLEHFHYLLKASMSLQLEKSPDLYRSPLLVSELHPNVMVRC
tara:strand:- start:632 stop:1363 length:732 start_codon:yes stop_codon:yes gene_type:complete